MPRFIWTEEMSVGDALMDDQHKQIVDLLNTLNDHMTPKDIYHAVTSMFHYAETHFRDEEKLLQDVGCPLLNKQQSEHQAFLAESLCLRQTEHGRLFPSHRPRHFSDKMAGESHSHGRHEVQTLPAEAWLLSPT